MRTSNPATETRTILFVDIVDYTRMTSKLTPTLFNELHNHFDRLINKAVNKHNGTIIKKIGDAFLAMFNDATEAVKAGIDMQRKFTEFNKNKQFILPVHIKVAVHTGKVMHRQNDIYGDAVNTTARIEKIAKKGQVIFSGSCYLQLDKHEFAYTKIGRKKLRGVCKPLTLFRVRSPEELRLKYNLEQQQKHRTGNTVTYKQLSRLHAQLFRNIHHLPRISLFSINNDYKSYDKNWLRDILYRHDASRVLGDWKTIEKTVNRILKNFLNNEYKIDSLLEDDNTPHMQSIVYYHKKSQDDHFWDHWNHKQHDSVGILLYLIAQLEDYKKTYIQKEIDHIRIVNKLVKYLQKMKYWDGVPDEYWEENEELHASSVGACVAGLEAISRLPKIKIPIGLIEKGRNTISKQVAVELKRKTFDASMLTLLEPESLVSKTQEKAILERAEKVIDSEMTGITYKNDFYMFDNMEHQRDVKMDFLGSWLALIYEKRGKHEKRKRILNKILSKYDEKTAPESFFVNSKELSKEKRLSWAEALFLSHQQYLIRELIEVDR
ncbi:MAG: adenylate/guanylate cyclase domain-containing protein [Candidatus Woesearchaeota archaeon]